MRINYGSFIASNDPLAVVEMPWIKDVPLSFLNALTRANGPIPDKRRTLGPQVCSWIEKTCVFGEGDRYGKPVAIEPWQRALLWKLYEIRDDGSRRFRFALISLGKGSGKSPIGGWVGNVDLAGPSVFGGWKKDGTPKAVRRNSPEVIIMASSYEQADLILDEMRVTFSVGPLAQYAVAMKGVVELKGERGKARRIPATVKKADGTKASTLIIDEAHELTSEKQENAYDVAAGGTAKRADSLVALFSTAGNDMNTMFGREFARGQRGEFSDDELFLYMCASEDLDASSDEGIAQGVIQANPLAASGVADIKRLVARFKSMPLFRAKRYFWNLWVPTDESWLPAGAWDACKGEVQFNPSWPTWVGADMALKRDSAAVVIVQIRPDGKYQASARIWFPNDGLIDQEEVDDYLRLICSTYQVQWIAADEAWWPTLPTLEAEGLPIFRMPQQGRNMILAYSRTYRLIVDQILIHDGAPDFADQIASAAPHSTDRGWTLRKGRNKRRIDACPALAGAVFASGQAPPAKEKELPRSQVF
ncbi:terminase large subunit domain-containing protein [Nonomuraea sp. SYSU D8015]|uniref:terminase large subunit domain-containing protein n=1 Tax=Nonomuraea sp. SYSU D8015 TaxID=2593644 RepID=UPI00166067EB|nr:terminase large subunit [Nonomuraea sp. SYSU D8015]